MNQDKILEATRRATEAPLELTRSMMELSKKLRNPSEKVNKTGTAIGGCVGIGLIFTGVVQGVVGKPLWALGTLAAGAATIVSHLICYHRKKN